MVFEAAPGAVNETRFIKVEPDLPHRRRPLPMTRAEAQARGWDEVDVVFVTGDAYVDHPSFAAAILGRVLESQGFRVGIVAQPDWHDCSAWKTFGRPRLFFAISAGNMDSMLNHYTANRKVRNDDAYSPGGRIGLRPDRATLAYCQRAREAYKGVPVVAGGVEASLRRLAHYDYWSDRVRRSILLDSKADLVVFGMGESAIVDIARRLQAGEAVTDLRDMRGVAYALGAKEMPPDGEGVVVLPSFEDIKADQQKQSTPSSDATEPLASVRAAPRGDSLHAIAPSYIAFAEATRRIHLETNPYNARTLVQWHDRQAVVCNPPRLPESAEDMDFFYGLPYTRKPHSSYNEAIPAYEMIKDSVTIMRGCFGGCTYCSLSAHQGRIVQSRSRASIIREIAELGKDKRFSGVVSDIGGPTANMYAMRCRRPEIESRCRRLSCLHPTMCRLLDTSHTPLIRLMREARQQPGIRKVFVASGVRMDLAQCSPEYIEELATYHVGGHLKVAPEHTNAATLELMKRPPVEDFKKFAEAFHKASAKAQREQYLVPYFISAHPGAELEAAIELAVFLKKHNYRPEQIQDFIPAPFDIAACMYHTNLDPITMTPVPVAKHLRDRKLHRALMQFFKSENYLMVRKTLLQAGRKDLIGNAPHCLIPAKPPLEASGVQRGQPCSTRPRSPSCFRLAPFARDIVWLPWD